MRSAARSGVREEARKRSERSVVQLKQLREWAGREVPGRVPEGPARSFVERMLKRAGANIDDAAVKDGSSSGSSDTGTSNTNG